MSKILSFEVSDEVYERIVTQQKRANIPYLSPFLRTLIEESLTVREHTPAITGEDKDNG